MARDVVITGIGLVTSLGEGLAPVLAAARDGAPPRLDRERFAPYAVHPAAPLEWDRQIPKKSDQRQMEAWQKLGCYAAGLALDDAGATSDAALKANMQVIVASGGGERDYAVDGAILTGLRDAAHPGAFLNERLMNDLRPTLFLAQLSNLLAGNIAIVHGVTGASRTFMGEEASGTDAIRIATARIATGEVDAMLVGGSYNAERPDVLLIYAMGGFLWTEPFRPVFERPAVGGGFVLGSGAAFLVLESREHAAARGKVPRAAITHVGATRTRRSPGDVAAALSDLWRGAGASPHDLLVSAATGAAAPTREERGALARLSPGREPVALGDLVGHTMEAGAAAAVALAAGLMERGGGEGALVTVVGHHRGEGVVRLARAG